MVHLLGKVELINIGFNMKKLAIALIILVFVGFIIYAIILQKEVRENFLQESYSGIVENLVVNNYDRGNISIKLNNQWLSLGSFEPYIQNKIKIGDSVVKESGTTELKVFRVIEGEWKKIKLKQKSKYNYPSY